MMKIITIIGARPQFIKAAAVSREIAKHKDIQEVIIHTGQHFDTNMSDIFFEELKIPHPNYNLGINGKSHGAMTGQMLEKIEEVLLIEKPDWVLVYGDTNSTIAGALAATKLHIKVAHVEAGLRSFNMKMPEEINRILTDRISNILFCPTTTAVENLIKEGYDSINCKIEKSGDVMQDAAMFYTKFATKPEVDVENDFILCTIHRAENTDDEDRLKSILQALNEIAKTKQIILPLHPRTRNIIKEKNIEIDTSNIKIIEPVGYLNMVWLLKHCSLVMSDSGGLQKEAFFFKRPCITLREETEWVELVENGYNVLAGSSYDKILDLYKNYKFNVNFDVNLYGGGIACSNIVNKLRNYENSDL